jgi:hypothetical protein
MVEKDTVLTGVLRAYEPMIYFWMADGIALRQPQRQIVADETS